MSRPLTRNRSTQLDVVRGIAILAVVVVHTFQSSVAEFPPTLIPDSSQIFVAVSYLRFGVELFFLLSGWLLFSTYVARSSQSTTTYVARRFTRIWPLWFVFSLLSFLTLLLQTTYSPVASRFTSDSVYGWVVSFIFVLLFLGWLSPELWNVPPGGWSIQVEVGHYSLFWALRRARTIPLLVSILVGYSTYFVATWISVHAWAPWVQQLADSWLRFGLYGTWPFFVCGGLAYLFIITSKEKAALSMVNQPKKALVIFFLVAVILIVAWWIPIPFGMTYEAVATCVVLLPVSWLVARWQVSGRLAAFLGRYSYFIYFAHFWVLIFIVPVVFRLFSPAGTDQSLTFWLVFSVTLVMTLVLSSLLAVPSWKFFESKLIAKAHSS